MLHQMMTTTLAPWADPSVLSSVGLCHTSWPLKVPRVKASVAANAIHAWILGQWPQCILSLKSAEYFETQRKKLKERRFLKQYAIAYKNIFERPSVQFSHSVISDSCDPMNRSTPGLPVHHQLPKSTQTHVYRVSDAILPSHPLSSPSLPAPNPSQHQGLFQWVNSSHQVAKVLEFQLQHQSFQWTSWTDLL